VQSKLVFNKEIKSAENPEETLQKKVDEYTERFANPYIAAERGYVDDVILPSQTRLKLVNAYQLLKTKVDTNPKKKHTNIPL